MLLYFHHFFWCSPFSCQVNVQAMKTSHNRELAAKEELVEEQRRSLQKHLRELDNDIEEERKTSSSAVTARKKLEADLRELEELHEMAARAKEDATKQMKKYHVRTRKYFLPPRPLCLSVSLSLSLLPSPSLSVSLYSNVFISSSVFLTRATSPLDHALNPLHLITIRACSTISNTQYCQSTSSRLSLSTGSYERHGQGA